MSDLVALLSPDGDARKHFQSLGEWINPFLDQVVAELSKTHLEDFTLKYGAVRANCCADANGNVQLNIQWEPTHGFSVYIAPTFDGAVAKMWRERHMIATLKEEANNGVQV